MVFKLLLCCNKNSVTAGILKPTKFYAMEKLRAKVSDIKAPLIVTDAEIFVDERVFWATIKQWQGTDYENENIKVPFKYFYECVTDMGLMDYWFDTYENWTMDEWVEEYRNKQHYYTPLVQKVLRYALIHGKLIDGPESIEFDYYNNPSVTAGI
jgi:hypothetical protein